MNELCNGNEKLIHIVRANIQELREGMTRHCALLEAIVNERSLKGEDIGDLMARCPVRDREAQLVAAIQKAVDVLEESKKSFKSKRLEGLRKDLIRALIDNG